MKKYVSLAFGIAATAFLITACNKQEMPSSAELTRISVNIAEQPGSKTVLDGTAVLWSAGDQIDVISNGGGRASSVYTLTSDAGTSVGEFAGTHASSLAPFFVAYPYREGNSKGGGTFNLAIPQLQQYAQNSFGPGANPMVGVTQAKDGDVNLYNLFGALRLALKGKVKVTKIEVIDLSGAPLYGTVKCAIVNNDLNLNYTIADGGNSVFLNCGDGVTLNESTATYFHICLPKGALATGCTIKLYNGLNLINTYTTNADHTITRGHITTIAPFTVEQGDIDEPVITDLSLEGTANCYILYEKGNYKFKAVQGNSNTAVAATSAAVLWETVNTTSAPIAGTLVSDAGYKDGYVTFQASGVKGNALIAAKDAEGTILWSWHIWIPESTVTSAAYSNGKTFMDRNLGALNATPGNTKGIGLLYQWGRKDPFMGICSFTANTPIKSTIDFQTNSEATTIANSIANPTVFYSDVDKKIATQRNWETSKSSNMWSKNKTIYDPCPAGYFVPENTYWDNVTDLVYNESDYGWTVEGKHWYPFTGVLQASDLLHHSIVSNGYYWNCISGTNQGQMLWTTKSAFQAKKSSDRAQAMAIRCCKI